MLTATTETALKALVLLASQYAPTEIVAPRELATRLGASQSYLAKTLNLLVRAGILKSTRGAQGGVTLAKHPNQITLLAVVEACQGIVTGSYCDSLGVATSRHVCAFHQAMFEVHMATVGTLKKWTVAMIAAKSAPSGPIADIADCKLRALSQAIASKRSGPNKRKSRPN